MNYDKKLINGMLFDDGETPLEDRLRLVGSIGHQFSPLNQPIYSAIVHHYEVYRKLPSRVTMEEKFPMFDFSANTEPFRFYLKDAYDWKQSTKLQGDLEKVALLLAEKKITEAMTEWSAAARQLDKIDITSSDIKVKENADAFKQMYLAKKQLGDARGLTTGYKCLDEITFGIQPGDFWVVAARPKSFKTFNLLNMCLAVSSDTSVEGPVVFFSKEMSKHQISMRFAALLGGNNYKLFKRYQLAEEQIDQMHDRMRAIESEVIIIGKDARFDYSPAYVKAKLMEYAPKMAFIDGIYLFANSKWEDQTDLTRTVREISLFTETPVVGTVQQNKSGKDVAYSDSYLQDASVLIYQTRAFDEVTEKATSSFKMHLKHSREDEEGDTFFVTIDFNTMEFAEGTEPKPLKDEFLTDAFA